MSDFPAKTRSPSDSPIAPLLLILPKLRRVKTPDNTRRPNRATVQEINGRLPDIYAATVIARDANMHEFTAARRDIARKKHPGILRGEGVTEADRTAATAEFQLLNRYIDVLQNSSDKAAYDRRLNATEGFASHASTNAQPRQQNGQAARSATGRGNDSLREAERREAERRAAERTVRLAARRAGPSRGDRDCVKLSRSLLGIPRAFKGFRTIEIDRKTKGAWSNLSPNTDIWKLRISVLACPEAADGFVIAIQL